MPPLRASARLENPDAAHETLGPHGNCQISALVSASGAVVWCCLPRFDSEPVFAALLDELAGGSMLIARMKGVGTQRYL